MDRLSLRVFIPRDAFDRKVLRVILAVLVIVLLLTFAGFWAAKDMVVVLNVWFFMI